MFFECVAKKSEFEIVYMCDLNFPPCCVYFVWKNWTELHNHTGTGRVIDCLKPHLLFPKDNGLDKKIPQHCLLKYKTGPRNFVQGFHLKVNFTKTGEVRVY